jgi:hypothetical protein
MGEQAREHLGARRALEVLWEMLHAVRRMIGGSGQDYVLGVGQVHVGSPNWTASASFIGTDEFPVIELTSHVL